MSIFVIEQSWNRNKMYEIERNELYSIMARWWRIVYKLKQSVRFHALIKKFVFALEERFKINHKQK